MIFKHFFLLKTCFKIEVGIIPRCTLYTGKYGTRKHVFTALNRNGVKYRVEKKKLEQILSKSYSFLIQTLNCIINFE